MDRGIHKKRRGASGLDILVIRLINLWGGYNTHLHSRRECEVVWGGYYRIWSRSVCEKKGWCNSKKKLVVGENYFQKKKWRKKNILVVIQKILHTHTVTHTNTYTQEHIFCFSFFWKNKKEHTHPVGTVVFVFKLLFIY